MTRSVEVIRSLIEYVAKPGSDTPLLQNDIDVIGDQRFRILAINLLGWIKRRLDKSEPGPKKLNPDFTWCQNLIDVLDQQGEVARVFEVRDGHLRFASCLPESEAKQIIADVDLRYSLTVMRTIKPQISG